MLCFKNILLYQLFYSYIILIKMLLRLRRSTNDKKIFKFTVAIKFCRMQFGWFLEAIIFAFIVWKSLVARPIYFVLATSIREGLVLECSSTNLYSKLYWILKTDQSLWSLSQLGIYEIHPSSGYNRMKDLKFTLIFLMFNKFNNIDSFIPWFTY